jgi:hypothetical protein
MPCIPDEMLDGHVPSYDDFLERRRQLTAAKIRSWFETV